MCEANVYCIDENKNEREVMLDVDAISAVNDRLRMVDLRGNHKEISAKITLVDFDLHKVVVEEPS